MTLAEIRSALGVKLKGTVTNKIFSSNPPEAMSESISDYVVISTPSRFRDVTDSGNRSIKSGLVFIECFARDKATDIEDTAKLDTMEKAVETVLGNLSVTVDGFRATFRGIYDAPVVKGFHGFVIILDIIV